MSTAAIALGPARPTDAGALGAILSEFVDTTGWMPRRHSRAEDIAHAGLMIDRGWVWVARADGDVAGFVARDGARVQSLYVRAGLRGAGIGGLLLEHAKRGSTRLELWTFEANTAAQRFYERAGFRLVERTCGQGNDEGLPDRRYLWQKEDSA